MNQIIVAHPQPDIEVCLKHGDLTQEKVDAIVNTLGEYPKMRGPLYESILRVGGSRISNDLEDFRGNYKL